MRRIRHNGNLSIRDFNPISNEDAEIINFHQPSSSSSSSFIRNKRKMKKSNVSSLQRCRHHHSSSFSSYNTILIMIFFLSLYCSFVPTSFIISSSSSSSYSVQASTNVMTENSSSSSSSEDNEDEEEIDLYSLSNEELEAICTNRGFDLVKEINKETGTYYEYTHEDYVQAAKECLEIESEMEDFFEKNPNLIPELEEETARMEAEKERLEAELANAKSKLDHEKEEGRKDAGTTKTKAAFVDSNELDTNDDIKSSSSNSDGDDGSKETKEDVLGEEEEDESVIDLDVMDSTSMGNETVKNDEPIEAAGGDDVDAEDENNSSTQEEEQEQEEEEDFEKENIKEDKDSTATDNDETPSPKDNESTSSSPLGLKSMAIDSLMGLRDQMKHDLDRVYNIVVPKPIRKPLKIVVRTAKDSTVRAVQIMKGPMKTLTNRILVIAKESGSNAVDMLKRYLIALVDSAKTTTTKNDGGDEKGTMGGDGEKKSSSNDAETK